MKVVLKVLKEVEIKTIYVKAGVRYWEDAMVNGIDDVDGSLIPCRDGDYWCPIIDLDTGIITNWIKGTTAKVHYKVCDDGVYQLKDSDGVTQIEKEGYVPSILCPEENGFGDYIIMKIDENGQINRWPKKPSIVDFFNVED